MTVRTHEDGWITRDVARCEALPRQSTANPLTAAWLARHLNRPNCGDALILEGRFVVAAAVNHPHYGQVGLREARWP